LATVRRWSHIKRAIEADVVFAAHNFIFQDVPKKLFDNVGTVIIEEDFTPHGFGTIDRLSIDGIFDGSSLAKHPVLHGADRRYAENYSATNDLDGIYKKICRVLNDAAEGKVKLREGVRDQKLTPTDCAEAGKLTWRRKRPAQMYPGMPLAQARGARRTRPTSSDLAEDRDNTARAREARQGERGTARPLRGRRYRQRGLQL
jgi:hypothetical protein